MQIKCFFGLCFDPTDKTEFSITVAKGQTERRKGRGERFRERGEKWMNGWVF